VEEIDKMKKEPEIKPIKLPRCKLCLHGKNFEIQKHIDDASLTAKEISERYSIPEHVIATHKNNSHREKLLAFGWMDYTVRKKGIEAADLLADFVTKWAEQLRVRKGDTIKDADALKAIMEYNRLHGDIVDRAEILVKQDIGEAIALHLSNSGDIDKKIKEQKKKDLDDFTKDIE